MENIINFPPDKFSQYIEYIKTLKYNNSDESFDLWGKCHRGMVNHLINQFNYPYLTYRINDYCDIIKEYWKEFNNNEPYQLILELIDFINENYKPKKYSHNVLKKYQQFILEAQNWLPYSYEIPDNETLFKIYNDIFVLKINLPHETKENSAYINWIVFRIKKFNIKFKLNQDQKITDKWNDIIKYLETDNKEKFLTINNNNIMILSMLGIIIVGLNMFVKYR